ncbi:TetR/AcrR family transcriptional regulator [Actinomyces haliotis]|uniref:TetR/AcrR family transcriptional regulator n=1 Tax=Actinomyces haliotis TaxID=1280843 RepID=UPI00188DD2EE|nr:TetR/AcrR family transcriptional regulator [Actinomyces haliotis]
MDMDLEPFAPVSTTPAGHRILDAATWLFREQGITATGVDSIAERASTTKRTLYQRFGSKDHLVACYLQQRAHNWQGELVTALQQASLAEGLDIVYDHTIRWAGDTLRGCAFANAWAEIGASDHQATRIILNEKNWMLALFTILAEGNHRMGGLLHLLHEGAQVTASIHQDPTVFTEARTASHHLLASRS